MQSAEITTMKITTLLLTLMASTALANPTTWTSADGRSIEARYLGRAADGSALVLVRADTGARVVVPVVALSDASRAAADALPRDPAPPSDDELAKAKRAELAKFAANYPAAPVSSHPDVVDAVRRYDFHLRGLASGDPAHNARALRTMIARDLPLIAQRGNVTLKEDDSTEERGKKRARIAAQGQIMSWVQALDSHAATIEKMGEQK
jgi:hypothetical protein